MAGFDVIPHSAGDFKTPGGLITTGVNDLYYKAMGAGKYNRKKEKEKEELNNDRMGYEQHI